VPVLMERKSESGRTRQRRAKRIGKRRHGTDGNKATSTVDTIPDARGPERAHTPLVDPVRPPVARPPHATITPRLLATDHESSDFVSDLPDLKPDRGEIGVGLGDGDDYFGEETFCSVS